MVYRVSKKQHISSVRSIESAGGSPRRKLFLKTAKSKTSIRNTSQDALNLQSLGPTTPVAQNKVLHKIFYRQDGKNTKSMQDLSISKASAEAKETSFRSIGVVKQQPARLSLKISGKDKQQLRPIDGEANAQLNKMVMLDSKTLISPKKMKHSLSALDMTASATRSNQLRD